MFDLVYSDKVSNTHSCPENGITNWYGKPELPHGYPGWKGRIWIFELHRPRSQLSWITDDVRAVRVWSGSGGAGLYDHHQVNNTIYQKIRELYQVDMAPRMKELCEFWNSRKRTIHAYSFECRIYLDDFPELFKDERQKLQNKNLMLKIKNPKAKEIPFKYQYGIFVPEMLEHFGIKVDCSFRHGEVI